MGSEKYPDTLLLQIDSISLSPLTILHPLCVIYGSGIYFWIYFALWSPRSVINNICSWRLAKQISESNHIQMHCGK